MEKFSAILPTGIEINEIETIYKLDFGSTLFICEDNLDNHYLCALSSYTICDPIILNYTIAKLDDKNLLQAIYRKIDLKTLYNSCSEKFMCKKAESKSIIRQESIIQLDKFDDDVLPPPGVIYLI